MTANRLIVLLDIYRGFTPSNHTGSLDMDINYLKERGLVNRVEGHYQTTTKGEQLIILLKEMAAHYG